MSSFFGIIGCSFVSPSSDPDWNLCIPASMKRRDPKIWHMAYSAAHKVLQESDVKPNSIITGTALGALDETKNFLDSVYDTGFGNPRYFIASVHNSMAGKLALEFKIPGPNITVCEGHNSLASSLVLLETLNESDFPVLVVLVDEHIELLDRLYPHFSSFCQGFLPLSWYDGAVALLLTDKADGYSMKIRAFPPMLCKEAPFKTIEELLTVYSPEFEGEIQFETSDSSYLQPGVSTFQHIASGNVPVAIGSYSPAANSGAIIEIR